MKTWIIPAVLTLLLQVLCYQCAPAQTQGGKPAGSQGAIKKQDAISPPAIVLVKPRPLKLHTAEPRVKPAARVKPPQVTDSIRLGTNRFSTLRTEMKRAESIRADLERDLLRPDKSLPTTAQPLATTALATEKSATKNKPPKTTPLETTPPLPTPAPDRPKNSSTLDQVALAPASTSSLVMPKPASVFTRIATRSSENPDAVNLPVQSIYLDDPLEKRKLRIVAGQEDSSAGDYTTPDYDRSEATAVGDLVPQHANPAMATDAIEVNEQIVPMATKPILEDVEMRADNGQVTLIATDARLPAVLRLIADHHKVNLILGPGVDGPVSVSIRDASLDEVLDAILGVAGFNWNRAGNMLYVTAAYADGTALNPRIQGRMIQVYRMDYLAAAEVEAVVNRLLSPVGSVFSSTAKSDDQLRTQEVLIVEDTVEAHERIAQYIAQIDVPPRQVLVEAHILQIALDDSDRHGINLRALADFEGAGITLEGSRFADSDTDGPSVALSVDGTDLDTLIELIQQNSNSRTLASPKVSVVNHQEAKIQIGQRLPYSVATTTQTSTIQNVQFLDVGIVLTVRPVITDDNHVLMSVSPKVSGGRITENGFPEEDTTEVSTTILMPDGGGVVIGGLIREEDVSTQASVPGLSRVPLVGKLFGRRTAEMRRDELVVALVTHVLPDVYSGRSHEMKELEQTLPFYAKQDLRHPQLGGSYQTTLPIPPQHAPVHPPVFQDQPVRHLPSLDSYRNSAAPTATKRR